MPHRPTQAAHTPGRWLCLYVSPQAAGMLAEVARARAGARADGSSCPFSALSMYRSTSTSSKGAQLWSMALGGSAVVESCVHAGKAWTCAKDGLAYVYTHLTPRAMHGVLHAQAAHNPHASCMDRDACACCFPCQGWKGCGRLLENGESAQRIAGL